MSIFASNRPTPAKMLGLLLWTTLLPINVMGGCNFSSLVHPVTTDAMVTWLPDEEKCEPDICNGLRLTDIPDASGHLPLPLFCSLDMYDSARALELFQGKYVVMFGDSTMEENMYDLILLLSGLPRDPEAMAHFLFSGVGQELNLPTAIELPLHSQPGHVLVVFHAPGRNVSISIPSHDILIRFRFTGHEDEKDSFHDLNAFAEPDWRADYRCMVEDVGPGCAPKHPDYIIINSGAKGMQKSLNDFAFGMQGFASFLGGIQSRLGTKVIWRGSNSLELAHAYQSVAEYYIRKEGITFFDLVPILDFFRTDLQTNCCSDIQTLARNHGLHVGVIGKYWYNHNEPGSRITISSLITQGLMNTMFA